MAAVALCIILHVCMCTVSASSFHADLKHMFPYSLLASHARQLSWPAVCLPHPSPLLTPALPPPTNHPPQVKASYKLS